MQAHVAIMAVLFLIAILVLIWAVLIEKLDENANPRTQGILLIVVFNCIGLGWLEFVIVSWLGGSAPNISKHGHAMIDITTQHNKAVVALLFNLVVVAIVICGGWWLGFRRMRQGKRNRR